MKEFNFNTIIVHGGVFHADDVFCVAMALLINPEINVVRTNRLSDDADYSDTIICDIGGGTYDHHQPDAELREDGMKYAACGLFYRDFGRAIFSEDDDYNTFRDLFIIPVEDGDNGVARNPLSTTISTFNPTWNSSENPDECFMEAVEFVKAIIIREIAKTKSKAEAKEIVDTIIDNAENGVGISDCYVPITLFVGTPICLFVSPSLRGGWQLLTVKRELGKFEDVIPLPESWLGEKPEGCTFVHQARFIASFDTKEHAVAAAMSVVE